VIFFFPKAVLKMGLPPFVRVGLPMVTFVLMGAWGLSKLNQGRFDDRERARQHFERLDQDKEAQARKRANGGKREFNMEEELAKMEKEIDLSKWEPKRIPRQGDKV
jgi:hypothetical protein